MESREEKWKKSYVGMEMIMMKNMIILVLYNLTCMMIVNLFVSVVTYAH